MRSSATRRSWVARRSPACLGDAYRELSGDARWPSGSRGHADLCAYFFLRAMQLLREGGQFGLAGNQHDCPRRHEGGRAGSTHRQRLRHSPCGAQPTLAGNGQSWKWRMCGCDEELERAVRPWTSKHTTGITPSSRHRGTRQPATPTGSQRTRAKSFKGPYVLGMGFMLEPDEAQRLIEKDARNQGRAVSLPQRGRPELPARPVSRAAGSSTSSTGRIGEGVPSTPIACESSRRRSSQSENVGTKGRFAQRAMQRWWQFGGQGEELLR